MTRRPRAHERKVAAFGEHDDVAAREHDLAVPVPAALPLDVARRRVEAPEDRLVETVQTAFVQHGGREPVLHARVAPELAHRELVLRRRGP